MSMIPKDKAKELFDKYYIICQEFTEEIQCSIQAKQCALIAVDEIIKSTRKEIKVRERVSYSKTGYDDVVIVQYDKFWIEVKQEIENL